MDFDFDFDYYDLETVLRSCNSSNNTQIEPFDLSLFDELQHHGSLGNLSQNEDQVSELDDDSLSLPAEEISTDLDDQHNYQSLAQGFHSEVKPNLTRAYKTAENDETLPKNHSREKLCSCDKCDMPLRLMQTSRKHQTAHAERPRPYSAAERFKSFRSRYNLKSHSITETERPYPCQDCNKPFKQKQTVIEGTLKELEKKKQV